MSVGSVGAGSGSVPWGIVANATGNPDPHMLREAINSQADTISALLSTKHSATVASRVGGAGGLDVYA